MKGHFPFFILCWLILLGMDLASYFIQKEFFYDPEAGRWIEITYQLILVYLSVCFFHTLSFLEREEKVRPLTIFGEAILLLPGFVLQSLFLGLAFLIGSFLLVVPGFYALVVLYFNPIIAVIYPDYQGKTFTLGPELVRPHWKIAIALILFTGLLPFATEGISWLVMGSVKSWLTPFLAPLDGGLYILCEAVIFQFVYQLVSEHRQSMSSKK